MQPEVPVPGGTAKPKSSGVVVPHRPTFVQSVASWILYVLLRLVMLTLRYRWADRGGFFKQPPAPNAIYCLWHNRLALCTKLYFGFAKKHNESEGIAAMVSASKDGAFLSGALELFGVKPVRGSTSRRGRQALLELTNWARKGYDLAITPDGPRGPCYQVQDGVIALAQLTRFPIVPMTYNLGWKIRLRSWDRFLVPLPFSRCEMIYDKPIYVPREITPEERAVLRTQVEKALKEISEE
jgi:lysophospholipid acyltransferase (LPLAT)-like uncharacterized protein